MEKLVLITVCIFGVARGLSLYREGVFTPAPPGGRPPCAAKGATFCENVDKYPSKIIQQLLSSKFTSFDEFFTDERSGLAEPPEYLLQEEPEEDETTTSRKTRSVRGHSDPIVSELSRRCPVLSKAAMPKLAANGEGEWKFVVQGEESGTNQKVVVHLCDSSEECSEYCTQFYSSIPMISVDKTGQIHKDSFWMPSSCKCYPQPVNDLRK